MHDTARQARERGLTCPIHPSSRRPALGHPPPTGNPDHPPPERASEWMGESGNLSIGFVGIVCRVLEHGLGGSPQRRLRFYRGRVHAAARVS